MTIKAILYLSKETDGLSEKAVEGIYLHSKQANKKRNISGFLCYKNGFFLQYIEGTEAAIDEVFTKIQMDPRHTVLINIADNTLESCRFENWSMHFVKKARIDELEVSCSLYEQLQMLKGYSSVPKKISNMLWQNVGVVSKYHIDLPTKTPTAAK